jgi:hypothetical protein
MLGGMATPRVEANYYMLGTGMANTPDRIADIVERRESLERIRPSRKVERPFGQVLEATAAAARKPAAAAAEGEAEKRVVRPGLFNPWAKEALEFEDPSGQALAGAKVVLRG